MTHFRVHVFTGHTRLAFDELLFCASFWDTVWVQSRRPSFEDCFRFRNVLFGRCTGVFPPPPPPPPVPHLWGLGAASWIPLSFLSPSALVQGKALAFLVARTGRPSPRSHVCGTLRRTARARERLSNVRNLIPNQKTCEKPSSVSVTHYPNIQVQIWASTFNSGSRQVGLCRSNVNSVFLGSESRSPAAGPETCLAHRESRAEGSYVLCPCHDCLSLNWKPILLAGNQELQLVMC